MKRGDIIQLDITGQGMEGEGIAKHEGLIVFVPYTLQGERVSAKVTFVKKNYANASVIKVINPSPDRVAPSCPVYYKCGGCDLMHIDSSRHREIKSDQLINNFRKIAAMDITLDEYVPSTNMTGYRNKVQLPFGIEKEKVVVGYYVNNTHSIVPCDECLLVGSWAHNLTKIVLNYANSSQISVYNESEHVGLLRHLVMRQVGDRVSIVLVLNGTELPRVERLIGMLDGQPIKYDLAININRERTNVITSEKYKLVKGGSVATCNILATKVELSPNSFMQVNDEIRDKIYRKAAGLLADCDVLIDLYSGIGITSNIMANVVKHVYSVEIVEDAVEDAKRIAEINGNASKITAICGDVADELPQIVTEIKAKYGERARVTILIDPPRKGCDRAVMEMLRELMPEQIIYISCNTATLARDVKVLNTMPQAATEECSAETVVGDSDGNAQANCGGQYVENYVISHIAAYDMFPNTHHVEALMHLSRK